MLFFSLFAFNSVSGQSSNMVPVTSCPTRPIFVTNSNQRSTETSGVTNDLVEINSSHVIFRVMRPSAMTTTSLVETKAASNGIQSACFTYNPGVPASPLFTKATAVSATVSGCSVDTYSIPIASYFGAPSNNSINCGRTKMSGDTYLGYFNIQSDARLSTAVSQLQQVNALVNPLVFQVTIPTTLTYRSTPEIQIPNTINIVQSYLPSIVYTKKNTTGSEGTITVSTEINLSTKYAGQTISWTNDFPVILPNALSFPSNVPWGSKSCVSLGNGKVRCETVASFNNFCQPNGGLQAIRTAQGKYKENFLVACPPNEASCNVGDTLPFTLEFDIGSNVDNEICAAVGIRVTTNLLGTFKFDLNTLTSLTNGWSNGKPAYGASEALKLNSPVSYSGAIGSPFALSALEITSVKLSCGLNCIASKSFEFIPTAPNYNAAAAQANSFKFLSNPGSKEWAIGFTPKMFSVDMESDPTKNPNNYFYNYRSFNFGVMQTSEQWVLEVTTRLQYSISQLNTLTRRSEGQEMSKTFKIPVGILPSPDPKSSDGYSYAIPLVAMAFGAALI